MPNEVEYRGDFRACFRFIMRQESPFDFLIVYLKANDSFNDDENIIAILSSNMSQDAYEVYLYPKAKDKSVEYVIKNYKKYFKSFDESQKKVLYPA